MRRILIVGAGFSGAVLAERLSRTTDDRIVVVDERDHLGGNCHTERDPQTGVMVHVYGPHIFNTSSDAVWSYVRRFGEFAPFVNRVKAVTARGVFSLPINLLTINQLFGKTFDPRQGEAFVRAQGDPSIGEPRNFEEQALKTVGPVLYETFLKGYTIKQWGCDPTELPASILRRLPVRFTYDDNYYAQRHQGIPVDGYTALIERMLDHENIAVRLGERYDPSWNADFDYVFYCGPIDAYFGFSAGRLGYRTIFFEKETAAVKDFQGNPVINYCEASTPYTRVHEHKHFAPWEDHDATVVFREFAKETGPEDTAFYPKRLKADMEALATYAELARAAERVSFVGRLATYRYLDMQHVIAEALQLAERFAAFEGPLEAFPTFAEPVV